MDTKALHQNSAESLSSSMQESSGAQLTWGLRNEELVFILDPSVKTGLACRCTCPDCGRRLVARHGTGKRMAHFAHEGGNQATCAHAQESALHRLAKRILEEHKGFQLPESRHHKTAEVIDPAGFYEYKNVRTEVAEGELRPDVIVEMPWGDLRVEVFVTNRVGGERLRKIRGSRHPTIEIDLRSCLSGDWASIVEAMIHSTSTKSWLCNRPFTPVVVNPQKSLPAIDGSLSIPTIPALVDCRFCGEVKPWSSFKGGKGTCHACLPREIAENIDFWKGLSLRKELP